MIFFRSILKKELPFFFACPALLWQTLFLYLPLFGLFIYSVTGYSDVTKSFYFTAFYYKQIFNITFFRIILNSFYLALFSALICLIVAYPIAYFLVLKVKKRYRTFLLVSLILPSWTSLIVQIYAWMFLLEKDFIGLFLYKLGFISHKFHLINNYFSIMLGTVYCWFPFMVLPLYAVLDRMDKKLLEASADLGANRFETLKNVILPISAPGIIVGFLLVFIPVFGEFAIPILLGGGKIAFWGNVLVERFLFLRDWKLGSAFAIVGIVLPLLILFLFYLIYKLVINVRKNIKRWRFING